MNAQDSFASVAVPRGHLAGASQVFFAAIRYLELSISRPFAAETLSPQDLVGNPVKGRAIPSSLRAIAPASTQVEGTFNAPEGFAGSLVQDEQPASTQVVFITPDAKYLFVCDCVGPSNIDLTVKYTEDSIGRQLIEPPWPTESRAIKPVLRRLRTHVPLPANMDLFNRLEMRGTSALLYQDRATGRSVARQGPPRLRDLAQTTGLCSVRPTDPELARFC